MKIKETMEKYFAAIHPGGEEDYIAEDFIYANSFLDRTLPGKNAYVEAAGRFFSTTTSVAIQRMIVDREQTAVVARDKVKSPKGQTKEFDVAEILTVKDGKLTSSTIFFDSKGLENL